MQSRTYGWLTLPLMLAACAESQHAETCAEWVQKCIYTQSGAFSPANPESADACVRAAKQTGVCK